MTTTRIRPVHNSDRERKQPDPASIASAIASEIGALKKPNVPNIRAIRVAYSKKLNDAGGDMVVKAMSWALRRLSTLDDKAVRRFLKRYDDRLAARVRREVNNKLRTGRKNPK